MAGTGSAVQILRFLRNIQTAAFEQKHALLFGRELARKGNTGDSAAGDANVIAAAGRRRFLLENVDDHRWA
ncbi:MAG: hypothetical protein MJE12_14805 [Alphaproteobacteria bacterium]|nr:hypothetical protein [Alphaproteobacteria bacterium]